METGKAGCGGELCTVEKCIFRDTTAFSHASGIVRGRKEQNKQEPTELAGQVL